MNLDAPLNLDALVGALKALRDQVAKVPTIRTGKVTSVAPLAITLDGQTEPLATSPVVLAAPVVQGQRVITIAWSGKRAVIGII